MTTLLWIVLATLLSGVLSVLAASIFLALPSKQREGALPHLVSFACGALLGAALLGLIPHSVQGAGIENVHEVGIALIAGIALLFVLEKFLLWRHCHDDHCAEHPLGDADAHTHDHGHAHHHEQVRKKASGSLVLIGDALHNVLDGVLIAVVGQQMQQGPTLAKNPRMEKSRRESEEAVRQALHTEVSEADW